MVVGKQAKDYWGKNEGSGKMRRRKWLSPFFFSHNPKFLYFFPSSHFPLNESWNVTLIYNYQQKCAIYEQKKSLPLFLLFFFLSPSFSFCSSLTHSSFFFPAPFLSLSPPAIVFCKIHTPVRIWIHYFQRIHRRSGSTIPERWIRGFGSTIPQCGSMIRIHVNRNRSATLLIYPASRRWRRPRRIVLQIWLERFAAPPRQTCAGNL